MLGPPGDLVLVQGMQAGGEPVVGPILHPDRLGEGAGVHDPQDRTEVFGAVELRTIPDALAHARGEQASLFVQLLRAGQPRLSLAQLGQARGELVTGRLDHRPHLHGGIRRCPHVQAEHRIGQLRREAPRTRHRADGDHQAGSGALLPGVPEGAGGHVLGRQVQVGVRGDHDGVLATGLGLDPQLGTPGGEQLGRLEATGEDQLIDPRIGDERTTDLVLGHIDHRQHPLGDPGLPEQAAQQGPAAARLGRRLHDHRTAGDQRRQGAPGGDRDREVPRRGDQRQRARAEDHALLPVEPFSLLRVVQREIDRLADLGVALLEGLAGLGGHHLEQLGAVPREHPGHAAQDHGALLHAQRPPGALGREGGGDRLLHTAQVLHARRLGLFDPQLGAADAAGDQIGPLLVRRRGHVGVRGVAEGPRHRRQRRGPQFGKPPRGLRGAVLVAMGADRGLLQGLDQGPREALPLPVEQLRGGIQLEGGRHEVLARGVLLQAPHQIGHGHVELLGRDHRDVQPHGAGGLAHHGLLGGGHTGQHLELHPAQRARCHLALEHEQMSEGDVEQVVPGHPQPHRGEPFVIQRLHQHPLVLGVGVLFAQQRRLRPAVHGGIDLLQGQIGPLDQSHLERGAAFGHAPLGEGSDPGHGVGGVGQIGLQHDPGGQRSQLGPIQQLLEHLQRQLQVPVLLHVHVQERGFRGARGIEVQGQQRLHDVIDGLGGGPQGQVVHDRGDLDRHVVDIGTRDQLPHSGQAPGGFLAAEHRLAEQIDVQRGPVSGQLGDGPGQRRLPGVQDQVRDHRAHHPAGHGHHQVRGHARGAAAELHHPPQRGGQETWRVLGEAPQLHGRRPGILGPDHPVDEGECELEPVGVTQQVGQQLGRSGHGAGARRLQPGAHLLGHVLDGDVGGEVLGGVRRGQRGLLLGHHDQR